MKLEWFISRHTIAVATAVVGLAAAFWFFIPGIILFAVGAGLLSPGLRKKAVKLADKIMYRGFGGR
jgi:UPF0716 family protein affecting phage T7 exclusion